MKYNERAFDRYREQGETLNLGSISRISLAHATSPRQSAVKSFPNNTKDQTTCLED